MTVWLEVGGKKVRVELAGTLGAGVAARGVLGRWTSRQWWTFGCLSRG